MMGKSWDRQTYELWQLAWIRTPIKDIAEELGRSEGAVRRKARALGIALGPRRGAEDLERWRQQPVVETAPTARAAKPARRAAAKAVRPASWALHPTH